MGKDILVCGNGPSCNEIEFIQKHPMIAEYYYGQYLPTGMQALALAVCLGFNNVYVAGYDLYSDLNNLHTYSIGEQMLESLFGIHYQKRCQTEKK